MAVRQNSKKRSIWDILIIVLFVAGALVFFYPTLSDAWNSYRQSKLTSGYTASVEQLEQEDDSRLFEEAQAYNDLHAQEKKYDPHGPNEEDDQTYKSHLNPGQSEIMGVLKIPVIDLQVNVYYGIDDTSMEQGVGHLKGTSLPLGTPSEHVVIAGHRGLPSAKLFSDLDKLEKGDIFYLDVLDRTFAYKVDQIKVVLPEQTEDLAVEDGEDYVTLLTCTPYGVNTHRLLVRGRRYDLPAQEAKQESQDMAHRLQTWQITLITAAGMAVLLLLGWLAYFLYKKKKSHNRRD